MSEIQNDELSIEFVNNYLKNYGVNNNTINLSKKQSNSFFNLLLLKSKLKKDFKKAKLIFFLFIRNFFKKYFSILLSFFLFFFGFISNIFKYLKFVFWICMKILNTLFSVSKKINRFTISKIETIIQTRQRKLNLLFFLD